MILLVLGYTWVNAGSHDLTIVTMMMMYDGIIHLFVMETDVNAEELFRISAAMSRCVPWRMILTGVVCTDENVYL